MPCTPRASVVLRFAMFALALGGCSREIDPAVDCPDITGHYTVPVDAGGARDAMLLGSGSYGVDRVEIARDGATAYRLRWRLDDATVVAYANELADRDRPRYAHWYAMMYGEPRRLRLAEAGPAGLERTLAALGPPTERTSTLHFGTDYTCKDGVLERGDLRVRRNGDVLGVQTMETLYRRVLTVWCGDGCRGIDVPIGSRIAASYAWRPSQDDGAWTDRRSLPQGRLRVPPTASADERRYLGVPAWPTDLPLLANSNDIRSRLQALAPPGVRVVSVDLDRDATVLVDARAPLDRRFLEALRAAGADVRDIDRRTGSPDRMELTLSADSPLLKRDTARR